MLRKGVIFGFGRMGITHMALFGGYAGGDVRWFVVEPNRLLRYVGRLLFVGRSVTFHKVVPAGSRFDFALVTSPVQFHRENYSALNGSATKVFIEKPLNVPGADIREVTNVLPGYVLRHNAMVLEFKRLTEEYGLDHLEVSLRANTASPGAAGWRFTQGNGVIEEFGSHALNLALFLMPGDGMLVESSFTSLVTQVPDVFEAAMVFGDRTVDVSANWADSGARKPNYKLSAHLKNGFRVHTDLYELTLLDSEDEIVVNTSLASEGAHSLYYLRGFEFSEQARYFFETDDFSSDLLDAVRTDQLIEEVASGNNSGR